MMMDQRAHVVTADLTFKGHKFRLFDDGTAQIIDRYTDLPVREITAAEANSRDGQVYRVVGKDAEGAEVIWRVVGACPRCASPSVYATPAYDIPT